MEFQKRPSPTTILFSAAELSQLDKLTKEVNQLAALPRRISRGHVIRAIIAMAGNARPERILKHLSF